jgi:hypothetical protein
LQDKINLSMREGYKISIMAYGGGQWFTCLTAYEHRSEQLLTKGLSEVPQEDGDFDKSSERQRFILTSGPEWPEEQVSMHKAMWTTGPAQSHVDHRTCKLHQLSILLFVHIQAR